MKRLVAIILAALVAVAALVGVAFALPVQGEAISGLEYGYVVSGTKSESVEFVGETAHDDTYYLFGSSELATMPDMVSTAPNNVLRAYDCGYQFTFNGYAYDQSLWMAIAAGAHEQAMPNRKLGLIVSLQWFTDGGQEPGIFKMRFSYPLYDAFCANPSISDETKRYVARRLHEEGVDQALVDAGVGKLPQDFLNNAVFDAMGDIKLRQALRDVRPEGSFPRQGTEPPDFEVLRERALIEAAAACSNNDFGVYNEYWDEYMAPNLESRAGEMAGETLTDTPEYDDLRCFMDVCRECGIEPYIIIMPTNGKWYDHAGLSPEVRAGCYERIRTMCSEAGVECLDLSPYEYEPYYLRDIMHFGWLGWLDVEQGFMQFVSGKAPGDSGIAQAAGDGEPYDASDAPQPAEPSEGGAR